MILTPENVATLSTEDLQEIVWEMHKEIVGIRPRWMNCREDYLSWLQYELQPEVLLQRQVERVDEDAYWAQFDAQQAVWDSMSSDSQQDMFNYPGAKYEHLEEVK